MLLCVRHGAVLEGKSIFIFQNLHADSARFLALRPPPTPKSKGARRGARCAVSYGASLALCLSSKDPLGSGGLREEGEREAGNSVGVPTWLSPSLGSALVKPRAEHG